jgi:hypothetical protein
MELDKIDFEKTLFNQGNTKNKRNTSSENAIEDMGKEKIDSLKKIILDIKEQISGREKLSKQVFNEAEKIKTEINNFLMESDPSSIVDPVQFREAMKEKNDLRQKKIELCETQLKEQVSCWQDVALLKKELREKEKDLSEKENRIKMFGEILKE